LEIKFIYKNVRFKDIKGGNFFRKNVRCLINQIAKREKKEFSFVNVVFCNDKYIIDYNKKYLGHDYETDIITFHDKDENDLIEGELLISVETVKSNSSKFKTTYEEEIYRVIAHGILHLCGYDDKTNSEKTKIRKKENYYIKKSDNAGKGN